MLTNIRQGFTVVELLIVIIVIGILAGITTVAYRGVQTRANDTQLASDAESVSEKIELAFVNNKAYPANLGALGTIQKDASTNLAYQTNANASEYCLTITSSKPGLPTYSVASEGKVIKGDCAAAGYNPGSSGGGSGGGGSTAYTGSPDEVRGGCVTGGMGWEWDAPSSSLVPQFAINDDYETIIVDNDLPAGGEFFYPAGQGAQGTGYLHVQFINTDGDYSETASAQATFYGDCYD